MPEYAPPHAPEFAPREDERFAARERLDVAGGFWWRWTRYEVRGGAICPARRATLERYDPWQGWQPGRRGTQASPYGSVFRLVDDFSEAAALEWCRTHGLLGVLLHRVRTATFAPQRRGRRPRAVAFTQDRHMRTPAGWSGVRWTVTREMARWWRMPSGVVIGRDLRRFDLEHERLATTWGRFFPDVEPGRRETYDYPRPLKDGFWRLYGEPLDAFHDGLQALAEAVRAADDARARDVQKLNALLLPIGPSAHLEGGRVRQKWRCPSLLATFAMMALLDLAAERRVLTCWACGGTFVSRAYQARYCSRTCRRRAEYHQRKAGRRP